MAKRRKRDSEIFLSFGKRLRALRLAKGLTPARFHDATGIDAEMLREYETGKLAPKLEAIMVMAKALGVSHLELFDIDIDIDGRDLR